MKDRIVSPPAAGDLKAREKLSRQTWIEPKLQRLGTSSAEFGVGVTIDAEGFS